MFERQTNSDETVKKMKTYTVLKDMNSEKIYNVNKNTKQPTTEELNEKIIPLRFLHAEQANKYASVNELHYAFPVGVTSYENE